MLRAYTDGSCLDNKNGLYCGWAFALVRGDEVLHEGSGGHPQGSNNVGEMAAVVDALQYLIDNRTRYFILEAATQIEIVSDSQYVVKGMNEWIHKWKRNGWVSHSGDAVKNESLWRKLDRLRNELESKGIEVTFKHIRGHRGDVFNERVDHLAGEAARKYKPTAQ